MIRPKHWAEPAHPKIVKNFDDLITIYRTIREQLQPVIDETFDRISQYIGFIVSTTLPVVIEAGKNGKITEIRLGTADLEHTIFAKEFTPVFEKLKKINLGNATVTPGTYNVILLWQSALRIRLKYDWMEPAHVRPVDTGAIASSIQAAKVRPEVQEPAHWFDGRIAIDVEEGLLIDVIDEVYPELKLADRVAMSRMNMRKYAPGVREPAHTIELQADELSATRALNPAMINPGIREPAHFNPGVREPAHINPGIREPAHFNPGVREPAHINPGIREPAHFLNLTDLMANPEKQGLLHELSAILKKINP